MKEVLKYIREVKECEEKEMIELLQTGKWIAVSAIKKENRFIFSMGRVLGRREDG